MVQYHCNSHLNVSLNGVIVVKKFNRSPRVYNIIEMKVFLKLIFQSSLTYTVLWGVRISK